MYEFEFLNKSEENFLTALLNYNVWLVGEVFHRLIFLISVQIPRAIVVFQRSEIFNPIATIHIRYLAIIAFYGFDDRFVDVSTDNAVITIRNAN
jgi:hypothetical protein